ncbi:hypothetical protein C5748_24650 [Phyllobacterium phragmitis]|uniref:Serine protease n=1 Tax=Phyllobacterium phragmitis TaxID=2670329 RepID=A0A2S9IK29_9HYPH|nr:serine protease [Phyllobacterium phragmitis]PRD40869.1 hypothetical protein C5748_24650 [Phyllobacterium phragmitis]
MGGASAEEASFSGTGFLINNNGWVVTNAHVVKGCTKLTVGSFGEAVDRQVDNLNDLAVLRLATPPAGRSPLKLRRAAPRLGEDVAAMGYPLSNILSDGVKITTGNINSLIGMENDTRYLQISTPIQPGNSGGPLVDRAGDVLGINTATLGLGITAQTGTVPQNVNFAVKGSVLELFLQSRNISFEASETTGNLMSTADIADKVSPSVYQILCYGELKREVANTPAQAENPPQTSDVGGAISDSVVRKATAFIHEYHRVWSSDNVTALDYMRGVYGSRVTFYGKNISKAELIAEKTKFAQRWPDRSYTVRPDTLDIKCEDYACIIRGVVNWSAYSPARNKTAKGVAAFVVGWDSVTGRILYENGKTVRDKR